MVGSKSIRKNTAMMRNLGDTHISIANILYREVSNHLENQSLDKRKGFDRKVIMGIRKLGGYLKKLETADKEDKRDENYPTVTREIVIAYLYATKIIANYSGEATMENTTDNISLEAKLRSIHMGMEFVFD